MRLCFLIHYQPSASSDAGYRSLSIVRSLPIYINIVITVSYGIQSTNTLLLYVCLQGWQRTDALQFACSMPCTVDSVQAVLVLLLLYVQ